MLPSPLTLKPHLLEFHDSKSPTSPLRITSSWALSVCFSPHPCWGLNPGLMLAKHEFCCPLRMVSWWHYHPYTILTYVSPWGQGTAIKLLAGQLNLDIWRALQVPFKLNPWFCSQTFSSIPSQVLDFYRSPDHPNYKTTVKTRFLSLSTGIFGIR